MQPVLSDPDAARMLSMRRLASALGFAGKGVRKIGEHH